MTNHGAVPAQVRPGAAESVPVEGGLGAVLVPVPDPTATVPVPHGDLSVGKWKVSRVGDRWGAFQPWVDDIYWLRLFDTFDAAAYFVRVAMARMTVDR